MYYQPVAKGYYLNLNQKAANKKEKCNFNLNSNKKWMPLIENKWMMKSILDIQAHSMRDNLILFGIPASYKEVLQEHLKLPTEIVKDSAELSIPWHPGWICLCHWCLTSGSSNLKVLVGLKSPSICKVHAHSFHLCTFISTCTGLDRQYSQYPNIIQGVPCCSPWQVFHWWYFLCCVLIWALFCYKNWYI